MKTKLISVLLFFASTFSTHAERYVSGLSCTITSYFGAAGPIVSVLHRHDLLTTAAHKAGGSLRAKDLQLVYDSSAQQFQVVQKKDGALVTVVYAISNEQEFNVNDGFTIGLNRDVLQQASLMEPGTSSIVGTIGGEVIEYFKLENPNQVYLVWTATFSVLSQTSGAFYQPLYLPPGTLSPYVGSPSLIQGQFLVHGLPFVPTGG